MTDERTRDDLYRAIEQLLGTRKADSFMTLLPPVGGADVAFTDDVRELEERLDLRLTRLEGAVSSLGQSTGAGLERLEAALGRLEARKAQVEKQVDRALRDQTRALALAAVGAIVTMTSLCLGVAGLAG